MGYPDMPIGISPVPMQYPLNTPPTSQMKAFPSHSLIPAQPLVDLTNTTATTDVPSASISPFNSSPTTVNEQKPFKLLKTLAEKKKSNPLPPIDRTKLLSSKDVVEKYPQFLFCSKLPTLAVKLCKESFFGKAIMSRCTVRGTGQFHALPETTLKEMKLFVMDLCVPRLTPTNIEFEATWKNCIESIGQACKAMRSSQTCN